MHFICQPPREPPPFELHEGCRSSAAPFDQNFLKDNSGQGKWATRVKHSAGTHGEPPINVCLWAFQTEVKILQVFPLCLSGCPCGTKHPLLRLSAAGCRPGPLPGDSGVGWLRGPDAPAPPWSCWLQRPPLPTPSPAPCLFQISVHTEDNTEMMRHQHRHLTLSRHTRPV